MDNVNKKNSQIRRMLVTAYCILIATGVLFVMFRVYNPNKNALGALSSVCMDVICIIILIILISSFATDNYKLKSTSRLFVCLLVATVWAVFLDFLNWAFDGSLEFGHLTFWFTLGSLCMGAVLAAIFALYLYSYIEETHELHGMRLRSIIIVVMNIISFCTSFILAVTGTAFKFVDGHYETGGLYDVVAIIPVLTLLYLTGFLVRFIKKIGWHDVFAVAGYIGFMLVGAAIESSYRIGTTYVAVAIADIFIYIMLQNEIIAQEKRHVQEWMKKSNMDVLTGFYNRYAYETDMKSLELNTISDDFVYVSVDVNSLKLVNDSYGHSAGDELILGAAECLNKCFGTYGKLYRIGGDEFTAIIFANEEQLNKAKADIVELTKAWCGNLVDSLTISCGYVTKADAKELDIRQIAVLADKRMYEAKREYYSRNGVDRRKNRS